MAVLKSTTVNGSLTATNTITATSDITTSGGIFRTTKNGNTVTIGSQNTEFCHIYNTANIPFIFNKTVTTLAGDLGTTQYAFSNARFKSTVYIGNLWNGTASTKSGVIIQPTGGIELYHNVNPYIDFHYANNTSDYTSRIIEEASGRLAVTRLRIISIDDVGGTTNSNPPFSIGALTGQHLEFDNNEIISKSDATTSSPLYLGDNTTGSIVSIMAAGGLAVFNGITSDHGDIIASQGAIISSLYPIYAGTNGNTTREISVQCRSGAGTLYMYSQASTTGGRGIFLPAHGSGASKTILSIDKDNNVGNFIVGSDTWDAGPSIHCRNNDNNVMLHASTSGNAGVYHGTGTGASAKWLILLNASGTVTANTSDRRFKIDKGYLNQDETYTILKETPIHNFIYKEDIEYNNLEQSGIIAQELRDILLEHNYKNKNYLLLNKMDKQQLKIAGKLNEEEDDIEEEIIEETEEEIKNNMTKGSPEPECTQSYYDLTLPEDEYRYEANYEAFIPLLWKGWQINDERLRRIEQLLESGEL